MLLNAENRIWIGRRIPKLHDETLNAALWQMPQGGMDAGEDPRDAAFRELMEETGVSSAEIIDQTNDWLTYDLPPHLVGRALKGRYRGQKQKWFAMRFTGEESEINIAPPVDEAPEFDAWKWADRDEVLASIVSFKREVYEQVLARFSTHCL